MEVEIIKNVTDVVMRNGEKVKRTLAEKGEIYKAKSYWIDPSKISLLYRVEDGYSPEINVYRNEVKILPSHN